MLCQLSEGRHGDIPTGVEERVSDMKILGRLAEEPVRGDGVDVEMRGICSDGNGLTGEDYRLFVIQVEVMPKVWPHSPGGGP